MIDDERLKEVLWSISLSDHMGDVQEAVEPILKYFGVTDDVDYGNLNSLLEGEKLYPEYAKKDCEE